MRRCVEQWIWHAHSRSHRRIIRERQIEVVRCRAMPGLVALVSHHDHIHLETLGTSAFGHPAPMKRHMIFRIASLTKPTTAAAAMILVEECKLSYASTNPSSRGCRNLQIAAC